MTLNAVNSFIAATPAVSVGLLFPHGFNTSSTLNQIKDASRVSVRNYEQQFANWNPTQHKLDIQKFADQFETIFWMDSDAIVYKDLTDLLLEFNQSACKVAFMKDHVCWNPQFLNAWSEFRHRTDPFVPQASFMGFKRDIIQSFFAEWKETWRQWIEPTPFTIYPNPLPHFPGSAFCTEQYALGMVLEGSLVKPEQIYVIRRMTFPLRTVPGMGPDGVTVTPNSSFDLKLSSFSMSERDLSEQEMRLAKMSFGSFSNFSFSGMSFTNTSFSNFSGPYFEFSGPSFNLSSGFSFSGPYFEFSGTSFNMTSFSGASSFFGSFSTSFSSSAGSFYPSSGSAALAGLSSFSGSGALGGQSSGGAPGQFWVPVDNIAGGIVHFYSSFYDQSYDWWKSNKDDVIPRLGDFWKDDKQ